MANEPRQSKADRREEARLKAVQLRAEQKKRERRNRIVGLGGLGVAVVALAVVVVFILGQDNKALLADVTRPTGSTITGGIPLTKGELAPLDGDKIKTTSGVPVVSVYADFICPNCGGFETVNHEDLDALQSDGAIVLDYHPISILDRSSTSEYSTRAAQAIATVADLDPTHVIAFNDALFTDQPAEGTAGLSDAEIATRATAAGVSQEAVDAISKGTFTKWVAAATQQSAKDGVTGTPTVKIDGKTWGGNWTNAGELKAAIEAAAKG